MGLRLLGPLEYSANGEVVDLGGARQQIVLAVLGLNANRVTPIEALIDAVWNTEPPVTARAQVQICVSGLRKVLGDAGAHATIRTRAPGYLLEIPPEELDIAEFTELVEAARTHVRADRRSEAVATLRRALALWRGPALASVPSDVAVREATWLEAERIAALMERIRLDLEFGRHEEVVGELAALVEAHPLSERLYEYLALALYRSGRQAEALATCRRVRATLIEELGIEPGDWLKRLEAAILNHDPGLELRPVVTKPQAGAPPPKIAGPLNVVPRRLPVSIADFTGREAQLVEIRQVLADDAGPATARFGTRIVAISGKAGVGKSALAIRAAHELRGAYPDGHLYGDLEVPNGEDRARALLARFLRALGVDGTAIPDDQAERADLYRSRLAGSRVLVVLDGARDEDQILPLLPAGAGAAVLVTSRTPMAGLPGAYQIHIDVLDLDMSLAMLGNIIGENRVRAERDSAIELVDLCGRLPLAIRVAGARLGSRPKWPLDRLVARLRHQPRRLDELSYHGLEVRSSIDVGYRALPAQARRLFRLFALTPTADFPDWTAAPLLDTDRHEADEMLELLVEAQLLDIVRYPGERLRYRFHDLIRVYAAERLADEDGERAAAVRRLLGAWLARAEEAHRAEYGGDYTILHGEATRWRPTDGGAAVEDPIAWLESERRGLVAAVHLAGEQGLDELCWDLALTSVTLFEVKGYFDDWEDAAGHALDATRAAGNRRGEAAMHYTLGTMRLFQRRIAEADERFRTALAMFRAVGDEHGCALVLRNMATVEGLRSRETAMAAIYREALEKMRVAGDKVGEAHILRNLAKVRLDESDVEGATELLRTALTRCEEVGYVRGEAQVLIRFAELHLHVNRVDQAHQALNRVLLIVRDIGDRIGEAHALYRLGIVRQRTGRLDNAENTLQHALSLARLAGERMIEGQALLGLAEISLARGDTDTGEAHATEARAVFGELGATLWLAKCLILLSDVNHALGRMREARQDVEQVGDLLDSVESAEAMRLKAELEALRTALLSGGSAGENGGTG
ncbi:AfsR/SARP family transcriptional regulator [Actinophytocola sp.]|uniref:AfsR/SARP family transcriptional regulator n=1 Tax=Actinophytocola sp. TaxID=1872138 RepID=UPI002ED7F7A0